ncbi:MAG: aspartate carbamoyltransferase catalytic subunit [Planctomycetota bacterium]|jgi:aspartate carbamoyltransferase catalytic subunit
MSGLRHLVSIDDLSTGEMNQLFEHARHFSENLRDSAETCRGLIAASIFYEPSTRTRLSFESAMLRLGGGVLTAADMTTSSVAKGESLADTVRVVSGAYADILVLRHPSEGAARLAAKYSTVPVINAGDGAHEHPTQTLCDLYTLWIEKGRIEGLNVVLSGDLLYSRTIHSFVYALARFGANLVCVPHAGLELPDYVLKRLREEFGAEPQAADASGLGQLAASSDVMYIALDPSRQKSGQAQGAGGLHRIQHVDAVYMTRPQTERFSSADSDSDYMTLNAESMSGEALRDAVVMHPLPRRDEIAPEFDADPRSLYFEQAARGVPIRMAILGMLLGRIDIDAVSPEPRRAVYTVNLPGNPCPNRGCISHTELRQAPASYRVVSRSPIRAVCSYCSHALEIALVGEVGQQRVMRPDSLGAEQIPLEGLVFFRGRAEARAAGYAV